MFGMADSPFISRDCAIRLEMNCLAASFWLEIRLRRVFLDEPCFG